ncbi:hypothetical protein [Anianabacter salinae]|uniref:hypothetical protein n=1 Tax=Anianabacter salinae TaxID=2851023 RepID=UPI00225E4FA6|nr:hypothetical protein [Anianabacter salinae]MBV0911187.1 hypothetical protein [Anianabacter salinae]
MTDLTAAPIAPGLRDVLRALVIWTLHFIVVYGAFSAACAEREVISYPASVVVVAVATPVAIVAAGWGLLRRGDAPLRIAARVAITISVLAILFNASPVLLLDGCR